MDGFETAVGEKDELFGSDSNSDSSAASADETSPLWSPHRKEYTLLKIVSHGETVVVALVIGSAEIGGEELFVVVAFPSSLWPRKSSARPVEKETVLRSVQAGVSVSLSTCGQGTIVAKQQV
jgi:hypothetical protein